MMLVLSGVHFPLSLFFVSDFQPLLLSFSIIMKGGMNKENAKKMLKGQSLKEVEHDSEPNVTPHKGNW
jgi:hypothetical protein